MSDPATPTCSVGGLPRFIASPDPSPCALADRRLVALGRHRHGQSWLVAAQSLSLDDGLHRYSGRRS
jgi:hypothetical protein